MVFSFVNRRESVVITGLGIVSCIGLNCEEVKRSLQNSFSGIKFLPERKRFGFRSGLSGVIEGFEYRGKLPKKWKKFLTEFSLWTLEALRQALEQAQLSPEDLRQNPRVGIIFGNDSSVVSAVEQVDILRTYGKTRYIGGGHIFKSMGSTITLNLGTLLGITGASLTISTACTSGSMAIATAAEFIASGQLDLVICGGAQEISWEFVCSFDALGAFSTREDVPEKASRPFDVNRDGLVPSGGAAVLILESLSHAHQRGAKILGRVFSYAHTSDGYHVSQPSGEGLKRAMLESLKGAKLEPSDIDLLMAHATSTPVGDRIEAQIITEIFDLPKRLPGPKICASKALTGHEFWMAGASQVIYGLLMAQEGFVAGHPNLEERDPEARYLDIPTVSIPYKIQYLMCNSAGFGGTNGCLILEVVHEN